MTIVSEVPSSILVENQKTKRQLEYQFGSLSSNGKIDFKNDALVVAARTAATDAMNDEQLKINATDLFIIDEAHLQQEYNSLLAQQEMQVILVQQAQAQTKTLSDQQESIYAQLIQSNETVADWENKKSDSKAKIEEYNNTISDLKLEKAGLITNHDNRIKGYEATLRNSRLEKETLSGKNADLVNKNNDLENANTSLSNDITGLNNRISALSASITDDMTDENKASIQAEIDNLRQQITNKENTISKNKQEIDQNKTKISDNNEQIDFLDNQIKKVQGQLDNEETAKQQTIKTYDEKIKKEESNLVSEEANLNTIEDQLDQEVYNLTGLTEENAKLMIAVAGAQVFLTSAQAMLKNTEAQLAIKQAELDEARKKTEDAKKEEEVATTTTDEKTATYQETENKVKVETQLKEHEEKNKQEFIG